MSFLIGGIVYIAIIMSTALMMDAFEVQWYIAWFICINTVSFLLYGFDKNKSISGGYRVPNAVLISLAILSGTIGSISAIYIFRHKTLMDRFKIVLFFILSVQILIIYFSYKFGIFCNYYYIFR